MARNVEPLSLERWRRVEPILDAALDVPAARRIEYLERACSGDAALRREVERLLDSCQRGAPLLDRVAAELAAPLLGGSETDDAAAGGRLRSGEVIGGYRVVRLLGRGGTGEVYLARDPALDRPVALKLLRPGLSLAEEATRRFLKEARAASALDHPNVQTVYEIGEAPDGRFFIVLAYYEGETLRDLVRRGPLGVDQALGIAAQLAEGLRAAHARGIVHRDIKPANVILTPDGVAKILDFGAAKVRGHTITQSEMALGTVAYMSPEQTVGAVDHRTDLWALGVLLHEMLTGARPFRADDEQALVYAIRHDEPGRVNRLRPEVPEAVGRVVRRCLRKDPDERYPHADVLIQELGALRVPPRRGGWRLPRTAAAVAGVAVLAVVGDLLVRGPSWGGTVPAAAATIAVMPFTPAVGDSALARLGRELVVTLSANLDGVGEIRAADALTLLAQVPEGEFPTPERGAALARRLGAGSVIHGSLVRAGASVRLDLALYETERLELLARAAVTAAPGDIVALTDSATLAILRPLWRRGEVPAPSLSAITTASMPALRAYLEGEEALARGEFRQAVGAFDRAFEADSTFWFAYWRSLYPRIYDRSRPDTMVLARVFAHRDRFPAPDRLLVESYLTTTTAERQQTLQEVTRRYPNYWPGWWEYGNMLVHWSPYLGTTYADARVALERVVALNPSFASGWEHLFWIATLQRDTAAAREALERLERFASLDAFRFNPEYMPFLRTLNELLSSRGDLRPERAAHTAEAFSELSGVPVEVIATSFLAYGFGRAQLQLADAMLKKGLRPEIVSAQWMGKSLAWAARGAWDSSLIAAGRWVRLSDDPWTPLRAYGLAVTGHSLGMVDPDGADGWRGTAAQSAAVQTPEGRAELAWLDGLRAWGRQDRQGISDAGDRVRNSESRWTDFLARSLEAFLGDAVGDRAGAARSLAALEWESAERGLHAGYGPHHPYVSSVHRVSASRWLVALGDTAQASRLLSWNEGVLVTSLDRLEAVNRMLEPLALLEQARIEEARGSYDLARQRYGGFLERYDMARGKSAALVEEARAALKRLRQADGADGSQRAGRPL